MSDVNDLGAGVERAGADADVGDREEIEHEVGDEGGAQSGADERERRREVVAEVTDVGRCAGGRGECVKRGRAGLPS